MVRARVHGGGLQTVSNSWARSQRVGRTNGFLLAIAVLLVLFPTLLRASCAAPANPIEAENCLTGAPQSQWDISSTSWSQYGGAGDPSIQGFATQISVNQGETVYFKINTPSNAYHLDIYRMGFYQGYGARLVQGNLQPSAKLPQHQPNCATDSSTNLVDCGTWGISASWAVPANATSGIYFAHLVRDDLAGADSHVVFVVRNDASTSAILFQTSDETWQAYNGYGGYSLYGPTNAYDLSNRAYKVSYNRPVTTRGFNPASWVFYAEYPMVRWLEANAYDVSYFTGVDASITGTNPSSPYPLLASNLILNHKAYFSVGHDEYWSGYGEIYNSSNSGQQRKNVETARSAGVNLAFFSGNEMFWKTRLEASIDGSSTPNRTLVCYKETAGESQIDPADISANIWTGTWRDPTFSPPADGGHPENALSGTWFRVNGCGPDNTDLSILVPAADGKMRFWRGTSIAAQTAGQTWTLPAGTLGYEWDTEEDNGARPAGLFHLSTASYGLTSDYLIDYGVTYGSGTATHHLTTYRAPSGALVFGAGSVQWSWGLDGNHDTMCSAGPYSTDVNMQQATVNLFADMGIQPATLQGGLLLATKSSDTTPPASTITSPISGASVTAETTVTITGTAADSGGVVGGVEVSVDGGTTWHPAEGRESWTYSWNPRSPGSYTIRSRAVDDSGNLETPGAGIGVTVTAASQTCPCSIWPANPTPANVHAADNLPVELGVKFQADYDGTVTGIRFYQSADNTGTHVGNLWTSSGSLLASVTFPNTSGPGWQVASFSQPVAITANTAYVASYHTNVGGYGADAGYFATAGIDDPPLHALQDGISGGDGVFAYDSSSCGVSTTGIPCFPTDSYQSTNYWVDLVYTFTPTATLTSIAVTPQNPPAINIGSTQQFTATGTYSDNSTQNLTSQVTWASSNTGAVTINSSGLATGIAGGTTHVSATLGSVTGSSTLSVLAAPLVITTSSLPAGAPGLPYAATLSGSGGVSPYAWSLASGSLLPPGLSLSLSGQITGTPTTAGTYTFTVQAKDSGSNEGGVNPQQTATKQLSITVLASAYTIWSPSAAPTTDDSGDTNAVEVGVKFKADLNGTINGIRFYKSSTNTGTHTGELWTTSGIKLATATFSGETASGWQQVNFSTPVAITAGTVYVASYHTSVGHYAKDANFFSASGVDNPPLHALQDGVSGGDGVFAYDTACGTPPCFPNSSFQASNYWVDVVFLPATAAALTSITVNPANPSLNINSTQQFTATGTFADSSTEDLTNAVTWASSNTAVATITGGGLATAVSGGTSQISATQGNVSGNTTLTVIAAPLAITTNSLPYGVPNQPYSVTLTATGGVLPYTWSLATGSTLPPGLTLASNGQITGAPSTLGSTSFTVQVTDSGTPGAQVNPQQTVTKQFTIVVEQVSFFSIFPSTAVPGTLDSGDTNATELGVKFTSDIAGTITGIRFYKASTNTGTHTGELWTSTGTLLATTTFTGESASGWQQVNFSNPVAITANTVYVASYHTTVGHYSKDASYFSTNGVDNPPLHALKDGVSGGDGVYSYDTQSGCNVALQPCFPVNTFESTNYWVDVVFVPNITVASLTLNPSSLVGDSSSTGTVTLNNPAQGNAIVTLSSDNSAATTPMTVTILNGTTSATFTVNTSQVASTTQANISAWFNGSTQSAPLTVNPHLASATSVSLTAGTNPSTYGQLLTFTATVTVSGPTPTGSVSFYDGGTCSSPGPILASAVGLISGQASFSSSALSAGAHNIQVCYSGDSNYSSSASSLAQTVNQVSTTTSLVSNLSTPTYGQSVTFTAVVSPSTATGTVQFLDGVVSLGTAVLSGGTASLSTSSLSVGFHSITANYTGDSNSLGSASAALLETTAVRVNAGGPAYIDSKNQAWQADTGFSGGATFSTAAAIAGTADPTLFQTQRYGTTAQYSFSVPDGTYLVNLYFAEIYSGCFKVGCRVFNVLVQGATAFPNLDVFAQVGGNTALVKSTTATVTNGTLTISFGSITQNPIINAIEILPTTVGTISGTVTNAANNAAISGATVSYSGGSTTTDGSGSYALSNVVTGTYTVTASAAGFLSSSQQNVSVTSGATTTTNFSLTAPPPTAIRVNAGGPAYIDSKNQSWQADTGFTGGATFSTAAAIAGTADPTLFQTQRYGTTMQYSFIVPNGAYVVNLYFAEIYSGCFKVGCRVFNVLVQGATAFPNLDVFAQVGGNTALVKSTTATVTNGTLTISFGSITQNPIINAIEILPTTVGTISGTVTNAANNAAISGATVSYSGGSTTTDGSGSYTLSNVVTGTYTVTASASGFQSSSQQNVTVTSGATTTTNFSLAANPPTVIRVNAGGPAYIDSKNQTWQADTGFSGGATFSTAAAIAGTADPTLFQTLRYGTTAQYSFSVPNGTYAVNLYFAEIWSGCFSVGCRVFNVLVQGTTAFPNLDVFAQVGANAALVKSTTASVTNGTLTINFGSITQSPIINAIEILQQ